MIFIFIDFSSVSELSKTYNYGNRIYLIRENGSLLFQISYIKSLLKVPVLFIICWS